METQPTPTVTNEDVARVVRRDFPPEQVADVLAILAEYGTERWHGEPPRVRLAALKIAAGRLEELRCQIDIAKRDFRDVLTWAEYPEYSKRSFHVRELPEDERQRIIDADWSQYQEWLARGRVVAMNDSYNLQRFVDAQNPVFEDVCSELRAGQKTGHWMWFVFPQIQGLGKSGTARQFAISSMAEAQAYLVHSILGPRLRECASLVASIEKPSAEEVFGGIDSLKLRSSMTLFAQATSDNKIFLDILEKYFGGELDKVTLQLLRKT